LLGGKTCGRPDRYNDIDMLPDQVRREFIQARRISLGEFALDDDVLAFEIAELRQFSR
jgi:hypothetical protein